MLRVCDRITDDALEERFEHATSFLVDHYERVELVCDLDRKRGPMEGSRREEITGWDTLDTTTTSETTDGRLGYALDVITKNLSVTFRTAFAEALSTLSAWKVC